ncbi:MAG: hypothetical protein VB859_11135, partial [Planctomycetaceae bacterium]
MSDSPNFNDNASPSLTQTGKYLIIVTAFLGWFFGGTHMAINGLAMRTAALNLMVISGEGELTAGDRTTLAELRKSLDSDEDGVIQTADFKKSGPEGGTGVEITQSDLKAVGLTKNPDRVKILGVAGDKDGIISTEELERYVVDARLGGPAGQWFGFYVCAFLFGAALGGLVFGR